MRTGPQRTGRRPEQAVLERQVAERHRVDVRVDARGVGVDAARVFPVSGSDASRRSAARAMPSCAGFAVGVERGRAEQLGQGAAASRACRSSWNSRSRAVT